VFEESAPSEFSGLRFETSTPFFLQAFVAKSLQRQRQVFANKPWREHQPSYNWSDEVDCNGWRSTWSKARQRMMKNLRRVMPSAYIGDDAIRFGRSPGAGLVSL
jgi:hypothetical protein